LWLLGLMVIAACTPQNEVELTLVAQNVALRTQIAAVYETATIDADRLQVTIEYMNTLVARAQEQRGQLQATLVAQGGGSAPVATVAAGSPAPLQLTPNTTDVLVTPNPQITPAETPTPPPGVPTLTNIVMSPDVGADDCATQPTTTFSATNTSEIYVVATANNITPGTNLLSRWNIAGATIVHDFTPDFEIDGNCIWFFIDQSEAEFLPGTWNVALEINGTPVGQPVQFTITE
jgi:hypothetical protein